MADDEYDILDTTDAGPAAIRGAAIRMLGYGAGLLLAVASTALLYRHLGVDETGQFVTVLSLAAIVQGLTDAGLTNIGVREFSTRSGEQRQEVIRLLLGLRIVITTVGVLLSIAFAALVGYEEVLVAGAALAGLAVVFQGMQQTAVAPLMSRLRMGQVTTTEFLRQAVTAAAVIGLVLVGAELLPFFATPLVGALAALALTIWLVKGQIPLRPTFGGTRAWELLRETLPYALASAANVIYLRVAVILMSLIAVADQVGYFGASFRVIDVLIVIPVLLVMTVFPIFARAGRDDHERLEYALQRTFEGGLVIGVGMALGLAVGAPFAIEVIAGSSFAPAADVLRVEAVVLVPIFATTAWSFGLLSLHRHRELLIVNCAALVLVAGLVLAVADHGAVEVAAATVVGELALALALAVVLARTRRSLRPRLRLVPRVAVAAAVAVGVTLLLSPPSLVGALLSVAIYLVVLVLVRGIPAELIVEGKAIVRRIRPAR